MAKKDLPSPKKVWFEWMDGKHQVFDCVSVWPKGVDEGVIGIRKLDGDWIWVVQANVRFYQYVTD